MGPDPREEYLYDRTEVCPRSTDVTRRKTGLWEERWRPRVEGLPDNGSGGNSPTGGVRLPGTTEKYSENEIRDP